jgi:hypothetical protein
LKKLEAFPHVTVTTKKDGVWFHFRQKALGLPLPLSGCRVKVHVSGAVTDLPVSASSGYRNRPRSWLGRK